MRQTEFHRYKKHCRERRPTKENPACIASRGTRVYELINSSLWWKRPDFFHGETIICPPQPEYTNNAPEQRTIAKIHKAMNYTKPLFNFERFSQLTRLLNTASKVAKASQIFPKQPWHYETNAKQVDIILGSDSFEDVAFDGKWQESNGLHLRNTVFRWTHLGQTPEKLERRQTAIVVLQTNIDLRSVWKTGSCNVQTTFTGRTDL